MIVQVRQRPGAEADTQQARVGFTVSRKVGNAVARNRVRRRLRAVVRNIMTDHAQPGIDLVIIGRRNSLKRQFSDLQGDLKTALKKLNAYR